MTGRKEGDSGSALPADHVRTKDNTRPSTDWREKIDKAKEAREAGQQLRKGKPVSFPTRHSPY